MFEADLFYSFDLKFPQIYENVWVVIFIIINAQVQKHRGILNYELGKKLKRWSIKTCYDLMGSNIYPTNNHKVTF
jgi:hypothetical protein